MTTNRFEALARRLVLVLGLGVAGAACEAGGGPPLDVPATEADEPPAPAPSSAAPPQAPQAPAPTVTPPASSRAALEAEAEADLVRLRALQLVEVGALRLPDQKTYCYGNPCVPGASWDHVLDDAYARIVPTLTRMTAVAERSAHNDYLPPSDARTAAADIASLDAMGIVKLGALLTVAPANNPNCYSLPCPEDEQRAAQVNAHKAGIVHAWRAELLAPKP